MRPETKEDLAIAGCGCALIMAALATLLGFTWAVIVTVSHAWHFWQ